MAQRRVVGTWIGASLLIVSVFVFESWMLDNWGWFRYVLAIALILVFWFQPPQPRGTGLAGAVKRHPLLKLWFVICAVAALGLFAATSVWHIRLDQDIGFRGLLLIFVVLVAPPLFAVEREKFQIAGDME